MLQKKRKRYWFYKILSVLVSCAFPIWAIYEKFPVWTMTHGATRSVGAGGILCMIVILIVFRKSVFKFLADRLKLRHAPPMVVWLALLIVSYILIYINSFLQDLNTVFWMGLIGCSIGTVLTYIAENRYGNKEEKKDE